MGLFSRKQSKVPSSPPPPLDLIRYVRVEYTSKRNANDRGIFDFEGTVEWSEYWKHWEIIIDSSYMTGDASIWRDSVCFLDANKNPIPMQGISFYIEDVIAGDCGRVVLCKA